MWLHVSMGTRRLFTAVRPPAAQLAELEDFLDAAGFRAAGVRVANPAKWHITLSFMPAAESLSVDALHDALLMLASSTSPLDLVLRGVGSFARAGVSTPIWIGVEGDLQAMQQLASGCRSAGHRSGIRVDSPKNYRPHLTIARRRPTEHGALWMHRLDQFSGTSWTVQELVLIDSILGGRGQPARHSIVERYPLTG